MSLTVKSALNEINSIRDRIGYAFEPNRYFILQHLKDENVQFFIKIMHECMHDSDGIMEFPEGYQANLIPSRKKMFFDALKYLLEYLD